MMNVLGKGLVLVHTFLSLVLLGWALSIFYQVGDFGWAVPPKDAVGRSIPSEYDRSLAALTEAVRDRGALLAPIPRAQQDLAAAESYFPKNHLYYVSELTRLRTAADTIEVKEIKAGTPLDTPNRPLGKPVLDDAPVEGVTKSYAGTRADLKKTHGDIDGVEEQIRDVVEKTKKLTYQLTGKDDAGNKDRPGLYDLIDQEYQAQVANKDERAYLKPIWSQRVDDAKRMRDRRDNLETTLKRLQPAAKK